MRQIKKFELKHACASFMCVVLYEWTTMKTLEFFFWSKEFIKKNCNKMDILFWKKILPIW